VPRGFRDYIHDESVRRWGESAMEIRVLGLVEARDARGPIPLGGPKPVTLLALLAVHAGEVVPLDRIVDALWGERNPQNVRATVHTHVSALRRALGQDVIVRHGGGYQLEVSDVDLRAFAERAHAGCRDLAARRYAEAAASLGGALELWRGAALGGAAGEWADGERRRLADLRLAVREDHLDAVLAANLPCPPVPELQELAAAHPLRERLRAQRMLVLAGFGRQAEALACFEEGRALLADELGVDPGPVLHQAHQQVLAGAPVPAQLPPDIRDFTGRTTEIAAVADGLPLVVISGAPGTGKSALAVHVAHDVRALFPDGQLHASLRGPNPLVRFLRALGAAEIPDAEDERVALYRTLLANRRVLVVLDDATDERQVRPLLPGAGGCVITSRTRLTALEGARHVELGPFDEDAAVELLHKQAGNLDRQAALEIVRLCGHLPLAVRIAGARLAARPDRSPNRFAARLRTRPLDELKAGDLDVRERYGAAWAGLSERARTALRRIGWFGAPEFDAWLVTELAGADVTDELIRARLLDPLGDNGLRITGLVTAFGRERALAEDTAEALRDAAGRVGERWLDQPSEPDQTVHVVEKVSELGLVDVAVRLATSSSTAFAQDNNFNLWWRTHKAALTAAQQAGDLASQGVLLVGLGWLRTEQDRLDEAADCYEQAIAAYRELGDANQIAGIQLRLSRVFRERGDLEAALALVTRLEHTEQTAHERGKVLTELGRLPEALDALETAGQDPMVQRSRSIAHRAAGDLEQAERLAVQAHRELTGLMSAYAAQSLAKVRIRLGGQPEDLLRHAWSTCHSMQDGFGQGLALRTLGELELARERPEQACRYLELSVRWWEVLSLPLWRARSLRTLSAAFTALGRTGDADKAHAEAHAVFLRTGAREAAEEPLQTLRRIP
jgi:DNA-binding SARP family transcriptional activator/tetratricopeptide (TPR) repeat protein